MQIPKYNEIMNGTYNELFVSFIPPLSEQYKNELDKLLIEKEECTTVDEWFEKKNGGGELTNGKSFSIKPQLDDPVKLYAKIIYKFLNKRNLTNSRFFVSDWRKYLFD